MDIDQLQDALMRLKLAGALVERAEFPPPPLPGLYNVDGMELTEQQVIRCAASLR